MIPTWYARLNTVLVFYVDNNDNKYINVKAYLYLLNYRLNCMNKALAMNPYLMFSTNTSHRLTM